MPEAYLTPAEPTPDQDEAFADFLQQVVKGVLGLDGRWVRPRWQPEPPPLPQQTQNWVAIGAPQQQDADSYGVLQPLANDAGSSVTQHETVEVMFTFYGPQSGAYAKQLMVGLLLDQNRWALQQAGIGHIGFGIITNVPALVKEQWQSRKDMSWRFRRAVQYTYPVLTFLSATGIIHNEHYDTPFTVEE
jgi:hypothetical protein